MVLLLKYLNQISSNIRFNKISSLIFSGESLTQDIFQESLDHIADNTQIYNFYGPTESTIDATSHRCTPADAFRTPPIGKPVSNTTIYILDDELNRVPLGTSGELYISGSGLARGYLNQPGLTSSKFIANPYSDSGSRMYKTGDLARFTGTGEIEFLGRRDNQVKLRGFRIELGEIESVLSSVSGVHQGVVLCREDTPGHKRLVGYVVRGSVLEQSEEELLTSIRSLCREQLPDYMQLSQILILSEMPLTPNGKIDRSLLPAPLGRDGIDRYIAPIGLLEESLSSIWSELLNIPKVGRDDNFFNLGGHSLLATRLISKIRDTQAVELPLKTIFNYPILKDLARELDGHYRTEGILPPIVATDRPERIPLSFAQQRLWFLEQLLPDTGLYHIPMNLRLSGDLDVLSLRAALDYLVVRHEILRSRLKSDSGVSYQEVLSSDTSFNLIELSIDELTCDTERFVEDFICKRFDFEREPLCRGLLLELGPHDYVLSIVFHHVISDGWSMDVFYRELCICYNCFRSSLSPELPELPVQYADFSIWQRSWLQGEVLQRQLDYWISQLSGYSHLNLPTDIPRPPEQSYLGGRVSQNISLDVLSSIRELCRSRGVTLFMYLLAILKGLLSRYSNQEDIILGTPIANRRHSCLDNVIGFFVNTLVLRTHVSRGISISDLIDVVEKTTLDAYEHQDIPFEQLVEHLNVSRDLSRHPLFQVMFVLDSLDSSKDECFSDIESDSYIVSSSISSKFDLTFNVEESPTGLSVSIDYATDLFTSSTMETLLSCYVSFIEQSVVSPDIRVSELSLLRESYKRQLDIWNDTNVSYPANMCIHHKFEEVVSASPDRIAVIYGNSQLSYECLNILSNQLSHYLREIGVSLEDIVAISVPRSLELLVGLLGTLKTGAAYVPLDPEYPQSRLDYMLSDSSASVLLTTSSLRDNYRDFPGTIVCLDESLFETQPTTNPKLQIPSSSLAYVIYTSGSTGKPKGVGAGHYNTLYRLLWQRDYCRLNHKDNFFLKTSISFDVSVWELMLFWVSGAILGSSPEMYGTTLAIISRLGTPGYPAPDKACKVVTLKFSKPNRS